MKTLIVYDSIYGSTQKIAEAIEEGLSLEKVKIIKAEEALADDVKAFDMLVVGSPTHGGKPSNSVQFFLNKLSNNSLESIKVAVFDTRLSEKDVNFALRLLIKTIGYAAEKIANSLKAKGGNLISEPKGFFVKGKEGPLKEGEIVRAREWTAELKKA